MPQYLYPQNLRAEAGMWLWSMRDFTLTAVCVLLSVLILATTRSPISLAVAAAYGFLTIRFEEVCILDFISWAARYFITTQQEYKWRARAEKKE